MSLSVDQNLRKAKRHAKRGELELAVRAYQSILDAYPQNQQAIDGMKALQRTSAAPAAGIARPSQQQVDGLTSLVNRGRLQEALVQGETLSRQFPDVWFFPNLLGTVNARMGHVEQAAACYQKALRLKPTNAATHYYLGNMQRLLGQPQQAIASYRTALTLHPDLAEAHLNLGITLDEIAKPQEAIASYANAIRIRPDYAEAHSNLGIALAHLGRLHEAIASYRSAVRINPDFAEAYNNLGDALERNKQSQEAAISCRKAIEIRPDYAEAHNNLGNALKHLGNRNQALASYSKALEINPGYADAHRNFSAIHRYEADDAHLSQLLERIEQPDLSAKDRMLLSFALGKAHDDIGRYEQAFAFFADGNWLRKAELRFDFAAVEKRLVQVQSLFSGDVPTVDPSEAQTGPISQEPAGSGRPSVIFIVGMPRSGTTLVEQILASHTQVHGAGELELMDQSVRAIDLGAGPLARDQIGAVRASYLAGLAGIDVAEPFVTDKLPFNFWWVGFIFAALPGAKVIHVRRDARATCWSNFRHYFSNTGIGFTNDLEEIAAYYKVYAQLMAFWHKKFPGQIYDLDYEALTERQEDETRNLLAYLNLDWEDRCLEFHRTDRAVHTASAEQVRQKMYQGSSREWRNYESHLGPMIALLNEY